MVSNSSVTFLEGGRVAEVSVLVGVVGVVGVGEYGTCETECTDRVVFVDPRFVMTAFFNLE